MSGAQERAANLRQTVKSCIAPTLSLRAEVGQPEEAQDCYGRDNAWWQPRTYLPQQWEAELETFRIEAVTLLSLPSPVLLP